MDWISVKDKLPERHQEVLFTNNTVEDWDGRPAPPMVYFGWFDFNAFHSFIDMRDTFRGCTHWMPIPEPPKYSEQ